MEVINLKDHGDKYREEYGNIIHYSFRGWPKADALGGWDRMKEDETVLGAVDENGVLMSVLIINDYISYLNGETVGMGGVGAVSSLGTQRKKGAIAECLRASLRLMYDRGYTMAALSPFKYEFYRKYGWELGYSSYYFGFPMDCLSSFRIKRNFVQITSKEDFVILRKIYERRAVLHNGTLKRSEKLWKKFFDAAFDSGDKSFVYRCDENGKPTSYAIFTADSGVFRVKEFIYDSIDDVSDMLGYIYLHSSQCSRVELKNICTPDDIVDIMPTKRIDISYGQGMMNRVVNAEKALSLYPFTDNGNVSVMLKDDELPENNGIFDIEVSDGRAEKISKRADDGKPVDIIIDIREFSQLMTGFRNILDLQRIGKIKVNSEKAKKIFKFKNVCALYDFF